jgi:protein tyrosine phosphatase (PTP) superfamily phosphohydrolase (DUF442 family)
MTVPGGEQPVLLDIDQRGVAQVVLNRPERNNAYDRALIQALLAALDTLEQTRGLRAVVVSGNGRHFQAGADLKWIDAVRTASRDENIAASRATAQAIWRLNAAPVPTIALVQGACFGGGTGLVAARPAGDRAEQGAHAPIGVDAARRAGFDAPHRPARRQAAIRRSRRRAGVVCGEACRAVAMTRDTSAGKLWVANTCATIASAKSGASHVGYNGVVLRSDRAA